MPAGAGHPPRPPAPYITSIICALQSGVRECVLDALVRLQRVTPDTMPVDDGHLLGMLHNAIAGGGVEEADGGGEFCPFAGGGLPFKAYNDLQYARDCRGKAVLALRHLLRAKAARAQGDAPVPSSGSGSSSNAAPYIPFALTKQLLTTADAPDQNPLTRAAAFEILEVYAPHLQLELADPHDVMPEPVAAAVATALERGTAWTAVEIIAHPVIVRNVGEYVMDVCTRAAMGKGCAAVVDAAFSCLAAVAKCGAHHGFFRGGIDVGDVSEHARVELLHDALCDAVARAVGFALTFDTAAAVAVFDDLAHETGRPGGDVHVRGSLHELALAALSCVLAVDPVRIPARFVTSHLVLPMFINALAVGVAPTIALDAGAGQRLLISVILGVLAQAAADAHSRPAILAYRADITRAVATWCDALHCVAPRLGRQADLLLQMMYL